MIYTIWLLVGAAIGAIIALLAGRPALKRGEQAEHELRNELDSKNGQLIELNRQVAESRTQCRALEERIASMQSAYEREELRRKEEESVRMQQQQAAFKNLANDILEEKSRQFKQTNNESLEQLLKPFRENLENYIKRLQKLEEIASSFSGVEKCYAIQAGREIRIIVKPEQVKDEDMPLIAREIVKRVETELEYPGTIKVHLTRESRAIDYAK